MWDVVLCCISFPTVCISREVRGLRQWLMCSGCFPAGPAGTHGCRSHWALDLCAPDLAAGPPTLLVMKWGDWFSRSEKGPSQLLVHFVVQHHEIQPSPEEQSSLALFYSLDFACLPDFVFLKIFFKGIMCWFSLKSCAFVTILVN